jgi:hypothetical protein
METTTPYKMRSPMRAPEWARKNAILILAISISLALHIFWLSALKVVVQLPKKEPIKFSKVSFLGPILERGMFEVRIEPRQRDFLEKRYLRSIGRISASAAPAAGRGIYPEEALDDAFFALNNGKMSALIQDAVSGSKLEPDYGAP